MYTVQRLVFLVVIILFQMRQFTANYQLAMSLDVDHNKVLYGHSFINISAITAVENCLEYCLANCFCLSFQICDDVSECQLCSSNKYLNSQAMRKRKRCTSYNFMDHREGKGSNQQCDSLMPVFNCCVKSNPCRNGGKCLPNFSSDMRKRFTCVCPNGYTGEQCEHLIRSCRGYSNGSRVSGKYLVLDANNNAFAVFCDFDKNSSMSWTLIQSYNIDNNDQLKRFPLFKDSPQNQNDPSWLQYRLSKFRMESIQQDSAKWRLTCEYQNDGVVYTDYLRASNSMINILTFKGNDTCVQVEYINVRGHNCSDCTALLRQTDERILYFRPSANNIYNCDFKFVPYECGNIRENNFGWYKCQSPKHRCSSSGSATTQTWFGVVD